MNHCELSTGGRFFCGHGVRSLFNACFHSEVTTFVCRVNCSGNVVQVIFFTLCAQVCLQNCGRHVHHGERNPPPNIPCPPTVCPPPHPSLSHPPLSSVVCLLPLIGTVHPVRHIQQGRSVPAIF